jgi:DNA gyrase subunit B
MKASKSSYKAADIEVLEGLEPVRKRPGMFIAGTDTQAGLHQLVFEIVDNSVDEAMNGHASCISVTLHKDQSSITVSDDGRGVPVDKHPKFKKPALELIFTTLHAGAKFSDKNYQTAGGLHGVGSSVVNALSEEMIVTVKRDGKQYQQKFSRGKVKSKLEHSKGSVKGTGTTVFFRPDKEIFKQINFNPSLIRAVLQTKAYLNPGLKVTFIVEGEGKTQEFYYKDGIRAYLKQLLDERKAKTVSQETFFIERTEDIHISIAFAWTEARAEEFLSYANGIHTPDGGSHEIAVKQGIVKAVRNYLNVHNLQPKGVKIAAEDIREGLICLVSVKLPSSFVQAQFQGQTKSKLNNPEISPAVENAARTLEQLLNEKPTVAEAILQRIILAAKAREASRAAVKNVTRKLGISHRLTLPGKLADCSSIKPNECELFIVEGDSAGGSTKQGRDRHFQAVLPVRGKVLNTISSPAKQVLENKELGNIISALGCGAGDEFRKDKLRYAKVIILTDADADGMHIATLLMAFFFVFLKGVVENGSLYLGRPPLYGVFPKGKGKVNAAAKNSFWAYTDEELEKLLVDKGLKGERIVRYKGLGEMNPATLWDTTLNPQTRTLLRVCVNDELGTMNALQALMGNDASKRFNLIQQYAPGLEVDI